MKKRKGHPARNRWILADLASKPCGDWVNHCRDWAITRGGSRGLQTLEIWPYFDKTANGVALRP